MENVGAGGDVRFADYDRIGGLFGAQRDWVAAPGHSYRLAIDGRSAVLAHDSIRSFVETYRAADLAGIEYRGNLPIGLLVEPEADRSPILPGLEAMQIAVSDLGEGNAHLPALEGHFGRGGQSR